MFDFDNEDHFTEHLATPGEADREYARNYGADHPEQAWILSDRDVWYPNPSYVGAPKPHPEDAIHAAELADEGR